MIEMPVLRWGKPYESLEKQEVVHFETGEVLANVHQANGGMLKMDKRHSQRARDVLRQFSIDQLIEMMAKAGELYLNGTLPLGNGTQSPADFCKMQSATTGLPEHMVAFNMKKGSIPIRPDVDASGMDICAQAGVIALKDASRQTPDPSMLMTPDVFGKVADVITKFWNTDMKSEEAQTQLVAVLSAK